MSIKTELENLSEEALLSIFDNNTSASDYLRNAELPQKGQYTKILNERGKSLGLIWNKPFIEKRICPVCDKSFEVGGRLGKSKNQITCSYSCSNTHFRSGSNNPNYKENYRTKCFEAWGKKCVICEESNIVAVHHIDENHDNDDIMNLAPMCPTHHQYLHSKYKELIIDKFNDWLNRRQYGIL